MLLSVVESREVEFGYGDLLESIRRRLDTLQGARLLRTLTGPELDEYDYLVILEAKLLRQRRRARGALSDTAS